MFDSTYRLLKLFSAVQKVNGRKKLQKMIHLLESHGNDFSFKYEYHFYGPYSADLQEEVNVLVQQGFLIESHTDGTYVYEITEKGLMFKENLERDGNYDFRINEDLLQKLVNESSQFLEMASTYVFLIDSGYSEEQAKSKALELKPHLHAYLDKVIQFYKDHMLKQ